MPLELEGAYISRQYRKLPYDIFECKVEIKYIEGLQGVKRCF